MIVVSAFEGCFVSATDANQSAMLASEIEIFPGLGLFSDFVALVNGSGT
jgi:hypothetical protein